MCVWGGGGGEEGVRAGVFKGTAQGRWGNSGGDGGGTRHSSKTTTSIISTTTATRLGFSSCRQISIVYKGTVGEVLYNRLIAVTLLLWQSFVIKFSFKRNAIFMKQSVI